MLWNFVVKDKAFGEKLSERLRDTHNKIRECLGLMPRKFCQKDKFKYLCKHQKCQ
jgi:hypothetical protein